MKKDKFVFLIPTIIHYIISLIFTLNFTNINTENKSSYIVFGIVEMLFFIILIVIYRYLFKIINKPKIIKENKKYIRTFFIYFIIMVLLLLCTWPGIWRWDEMWIAIKANEYILEGWQNILSSFFYLLSYKFIASNVGVVIIQIILISMIVSYVINKIYDYFNFKTEKFKFLLYIPFLLFPVLDNNLYPIRSTLYSYIILLWIIKMVDCYKSKKINWKDSIVITILSSLIANLRKEGIYFIGVFVIFYIFFLKEDKLNLKNMLISILTLFLLTFILYQSNTLYMGSSENNRYNIISTTGSLPLLVENAYKDSEIELLNSIDEFVAVDLLLDKINNNENNIEWNRILRYENLNNKTTKYMNAYMKLNLKYSLKVLKARIDNINGVYNSKNINLFNSTLNYASAKELNDYYNNYDFVSLFLEFDRINNGFSKAINKDLRKNVISVLEGRKLNDYHAETIIYKLWYIYPPIIISFIFLIYLLIKKKWFYLLLLSSVVAKAILVFLAQPSFLFMYYFSDYLVGYLLLIVFILLKVKKISSKSDM